MFAMTSGTTNRPKTIPVTRESLQRLSRRLDHLGHPGLRRPPGRSSTTASGRSSRSPATGARRHTAAGIPCGAITGLTASMQNPLVRTDLLHAACAVADQGHRGEVLRRLRLSVYRDLGTIIAANPSTMLAIARLGDREKRDADPRPPRRHDRPASGRSPTTSARQLRLRTRIRRKATARAARGDRRPDRPAAADGLLAEPGVPRQLDRRDDGGLPPPVSRVLRRQAGPRRRPDRLRGPDDDPDRGRHARPGSSTSGTTTSSSSPRSRGTARSPRRSRPPTWSRAATTSSCLTTAGGLYRYNIHDLVRCVGFHGKAPVVEFLNKGAHFSSLTGEKLSEHQVVAAVEAAQAGLGLRLRSFLLLPIWGDPPSYGLLVEDRDLPETERRRPLRRRRRGAAPAAQRRVRLQARHPPTRPRPHDPTAATAPGPNSRNGVWRGAAGTVEQYKQPHLIPDPNEIGNFPTLDSVAP